MLHGIVIKHLNFANQSVCLLFETRHLNVCIFFSFEMIWIVQCGFQNFNIRDVTRVCVYYLSLFWLHLITGHIPFSELYIYTNSMFIFRFDFFIVGHLLTISLDLDKIIYSKALGKTITSVSAMYIYK
jgi:hypothetical protein